MVYAVLKSNDNSSAVLFDSMEEYIKATFSSSIETLFVMEFKIGGRTYRERKDNLKQLAIDWSNNQAPGLSQGELWKVEKFFLWNGKTYGLRNEFRENAIC